ncbi:hypothetical protein VM1G_11500 [Cytospora mali]|uniref:Uncharacterized protein n=1 Tax=Cytospora mali TaxID=578113 RepID=A0A194VSY4_CYTMA|nr:hypothetical protein VM1G_11500 [Valsa mali]
MVVQRVRMRQETAELFYILPGLVKLPGIIPPIVLDTRLDLNQGLLPVSHRDLGIRARVLTNVPSTVIIRPLQTRLRGGLHEVTQVGAREASAPLVHGDLAEPPVHHAPVLPGGGDGVPVDGPQDVHPLVGGGQADEDAGAEAAGPADGRVDAVGPVGGADDVDAAAVADAVELGEEGVDDAGAGVGERVVALGHQGGALLLARANSCRTARSDSPTYLFSSSGPLMEMKLALDSLATALATSVFPQPGGPHRRMPAADLMPTRANRSGYLMGPMMVISSFLRTSLSAPTCCHVVLGTALKPSRLAAGCTVDTAAVKSAWVMLTGPTSTSLEAFMRRTARRPAVVVVVAGPASTGTSRSSGADPSARYLSARRSVRARIDLDTAAETTCFRSAPTYPGVSFASAAKSTSSASARSRVMDRRIFSLAGSFGMPMSTSTPKRLRTTGSIPSGLLHDDVGGILVVGRDPVRSRAVLTAARDAVHAAADLGDDAALHGLPGAVALPGDGVQLVEEDEARREAHGLVEDVADVLLALAARAAHQARGRHGDEGDLEVGRQRVRQHRLAAPGRPVEQHPVVEPVPRLGQVLGLQERDAHRVDEPLHHRVDARQVVEVDVLRRRPVDLLGVLAPPLGPGLAVRLPVHGRRGRVVDVHGVRPAGRLSPRRRGRAAAAAAAAPRRALEPPVLGELPVEEPGGLLLAQALGAVRPGLQLPLQLLVRVPVGLGLVPAQAQDPLDRVLQHALLLALEAGVGPLHVLVHGADGDPGGPSAAGGRLLVFG